MERSTELARDRPILFGPQTFWPYNLIIPNRQRCQGLISDADFSLTSGAPLTVSAADAEGAMPYLTYRGASKAIRYGLTGVTIRANG
jgi:hypothetical protein